MSWQFKLASSMRVSPSPLRASMTRPNGLLLRPTARVAGGFSVSGTWVHVRPLYISIGPSGSVLSSYDCVLALWLHT